MNGEMNGNVLCAVIGKSVVSVRITFKYFQILLEFIRAPHKYIESRFEAIRCLPKKKREKRVKKIVVFGALHHLFDVLFWYLLCACNEILLL